MIFDSDWLRERNIEQVVKANGCLIIATINTDYDEKGNFIGDYSKEFKLAEKYVKKYNPKRLSQERYKIKCEKP